MVVVNDARSVRDGRPEGIAEVLLVEGDHGIHVVSGVLSVHREHQVSFRAQRCGSSSVTLDRGRIGRPVRDRGSLSGGEVVFAAGDAQEFVAKSHQKDVCVAVGIEHGRHLIDGRTLLLTSLE
jgi:hypothetical protein